MALDLQKLVIRRLLESQNSDLYSKLSPRFFVGSNLILFSKIENFYKNNLRIPTIDEFLVIKKDISLQDYLSSQILSDENQNNNIQNEFLVSQLQDFFVREETIEFIDEFLSNLSDYESSEIMDKFQNHLLGLNSAIPMGEELIDVATLETVPSEDTFVMYPSGLSDEYDTINGGFSLQEFVALGGRRGSGKSILALNATLYRFLGKSMTAPFKPSTVAFYSIEMRYIEVYYRLMSILTEIPFLNFMRGTLRKEDRYHAAKVKMDTFYKPDQKVIKEGLKKLESDDNIKEFDALIRAEKPKFKEHRLFLIDDQSLTLNRIDHYCNMFKNKYADYTMATVDYLNIINIEDSKDWKSQITVAENLKGISRKYDLTVLSPYQVDATLEARYAKGILDSADRAFVFSPADREGDDSDKLTLYTAKIRNGRNLTFDVHMNWECTKIDNRRNLKTENPESKLLPGAQYGAGTEEASRDV